MWKRTCTEHQVRSKLQRMGGGGQHAQRVHNQITQLQGLLLHTKIHLHGGPGPRRAQARRQRSTARASKSHMT